MLTYKTTIEKPRLVIEHDDAESPREWGNLGYFVTIDSEMHSPDDNQEVMEIIKSCGDIAKDQIDHMALITTAIKSYLNEKVLAIYPIVKYEHSSIVYKLGKIKGYDYSNNGFYIVTDYSRKDLGTKKKDFLKVINQELEDYNKWVNGEVYRYTLFDLAGEWVDSCGGFYDIEDMRNYLPEEFKNERLVDYRIN